MTNYDEQFNLRKRHPLGRIHLLKNAVQSYVARHKLHCELDISYGESLGQKLDIFPAKQPNSPVFVFIHGGYFRSLDKRQYSYMAKPLVKAGFTVALVNYDLAPKVSVGEIVQQNINAFRWLHTHIKGYNGDPNNITLCGHSVGAFLVAKILEQDWSKEVKQSVRTAVLLSGIFDLSKVKQSYLNQDLGLSEQDVTELSPIFTTCQPFPKTIVAVGDQETEEFIKQSEHYAKRLTANGTPVQWMLLPNKNHYTVSRMLSNKKNTLMAKLLNG